MAQTRLSPDQLIKETFFLVEATSFEQFSLWEKYHSRVNWKEETRGISQQVGTLDNRPVVVSIRWAWISDRPVAFWNATSQVVDHVMIQKWFSDNCVPPKWDKGTRNARCDATNFHHCLDAIRGANSR